MTTIGSFEAKTQLPQLLDRVALGERITITKRGKPVAMLVPPEKAESKDVNDVIREFKEYSRQKKRTLGKLTFRKMIEEGRRL